MSGSRLFIAAAGSGKTSFIINEVLKNCDERSIITTFTRANESSIRERLIKANKGTIPSHVTIQTWFSFLIEHGIRPYRFWPKRINGMHLVNKASGVRYYSKNDMPIYWREKDFFDSHYFTPTMDIYSDKLSKLVYRCNEKSKGHVIKRLEKIYHHIYIDEVQDMAGWDLEIIKLIIKSNLRLTMVGDPRQTVYLTHNDRKNPKYDYGKIKEYIKNECSTCNCLIDESTLNCSYRNSSDICKLSSKLFPLHLSCSSRLSHTDSHMGIFFIKKQDLQKYYDSYSPLLLRLKSNVPTHIDAPSITFGHSKGLEAKHILLYPTKDMLSWLCNQSVNLKGKTCAQLYVGLTRAFFSIGIVVENNFNKPVEGINIWS